MIPPKYLADHDLNDQIVDGVLRRVPSVEFLRLRDIDLSDRPDTEVLAYAAVHGLIVVSHDVNTMPASAYARLGAGNEMAGLFLARQSDPVAAIIDSLVLIQLSSDDAEWRGRVVFLPL